MFGFLSSQHQAIYTVKDFMSKVLVYIFLALLLALPFVGQAQDGANTKFGLGFNIGLNTSNGMGPKIIYTPWNFWQLDIAIGKTAYNGFKFAGGTKFYPLKRRELNPYFGIYYGFTTGQDVKSRFGNSRELYTTYSNAYLHPHGGISIYGDMLQHTFALGYSLLMNDYRLDVNADNTTNENQDQIESKLKGGVMLSYTIWIYLKKPRR